METIVSYLNRQYSNINLERTSYVSQGIPVKPVVARTVADVVSEIHTQIYLPYQKCIDFCRNE